MKRWKPYASLLLALMMCLGLAACGGGEDEDTAPATIEGIVIDDSVEYDYDVFLGTWLGEEDTMLTVEKFDDGRAHFLLSDANDEWIASGIFQYAEEYGYVYAHNDYDGIAYQCWFGESDTPYIDTLGTFTKVSGDVPGDTIGDESGLDISALSGSWLPDGETDAETTIDISDDTWVLWMLDSDGMWGMMDSGSLQDLGDGDFAAISEYDGEVYEIFLVDNETMFWNDDYYLKAE